MAYAGTLIRIRNAVFFLTAGHVLRDVERTLRNSEVEIQSAVLADTFGWQRVTNHPIPFDLKNAHWFFIDDDQDGLDFGVIGLDPYYVRLLDSNGMVALEEKNWIHQPTVKFDGHLMLGLPNEFTSEHVSVSGEGFVSPTLLRVHQLESPPDDKVTLYPRFVGQIDHNLPLKGMAGMSGGPIFGIRFGPPLRYWIVALQSSWNRGRRTVFGCPIPVLASLLTEWTDECFPR